MIKREMMKVWSLDFPRLILGPEEAERLVFVMQGNGLDLYTLRSIHLMTVVSQ